MNNIFIRIKTVAILSLVCCPFYSMQSIPAEIQNTYEPSLEHIFNGIEADITWNQVSDIDKQTIIELISINQTSNPLQYVKNVIIHFLISRIQHMPFTKQLVDMNQALVNSIPEQENIKYSTLLKFTNINSNSLSHS